MTNLDLSKNPHRRYNPLTQEWVFVSPHRTSRPWQGNLEKPTSLNSLSYDPDCYLCPGNSRSSGEINKKYSSTFSFVNDFSAMLPNTTENEINENDLLIAKGLKGISKVLCFSPNHNVTLAMMKPNEIVNVVNLWQNEFYELSKSYKWIQIFENKGAIMGCSNPHPHGQIWAGSELPNEANKENISQKKYYAKNNSLLLLDYLDKELEKKERIIVENEDWVVLVPFWAVWPFETLLLPKKNKSNLLQLTESEKLSLVDAIKSILVKYDNIFEYSFPYTMGWHNSPNIDNIDYWQLHAHFYPPLLRSAEIKKFMVGYEMLSEAQRDITAEQAAQKLKEMPIVHFMDN